MKFIDLFAGLGGFHLALTRLGHECVFACEKDEQLRTLYEKNFGIKPEGDIRDVNLQAIPNHDILCAGFPCQPFSKATPTHRRKGLKCPDRGDLFNYVIEILKIKKPRYFILENVQNIRKHDNEQTWAEIRKSLDDAGYNVDEGCFSPDQFGIPQIRRRIFIVGNREGAAKLPELPADAKPDLSAILDKNPPDARQLTNQQMKYLEVWQEFLKQLPKDKNLPSAPIWSMEFGANYPFEKETPYAAGIDTLREYRGNHGTLLEDLTENEVWQHLPSYVHPRYERNKREKFPQWKIRFIQENRSFYENNKEWIDEWKQNISDFPQSYQKFEWNCKGEARDLWNLWDFVIQFRASGVRVKKATKAPSLLAMAGHVPIIGWEKRYMTQRECSRLQGMACSPDESHLKGVAKEALDIPKTPSRAFTALGNAVNVDVVERIAEALTSNSEDCTDPAEQLDFSIDMRKD